MNKSFTSNSILHITPHLGGGVGTVLLNWVVEDKANTHAIVTLDFANDKAKELCAHQNIDLYSQIQYKEIHELITQYDILIIHFWNHPLLYDFLVRNTLPACRTIFYAHVSGFYPPNLITQKALNYPDIFVYTTAISKEIDSKHEVILSTGGVENYTEIEPKTDTFTLGYIGTVDYSKMHPKYIETLGKSSIENFLIVGGDAEKEIAKTADSRFQFTGKVADIRPYLAKMNVFAYMLNPLHFGTAEQVLQEAMAAGVVPLVLNNKCESALVEHEKTGLVAKNVEEYLDYIEKLKNNPVLLKELSQNAKTYALKEFSIANFLEKWQAIFDRVLKIEKSPKKWDIEKENIQAFDLFLESLGDYHDEFLKSDEDIKHYINTAHWQSKSKGTPKQYYIFFHDDKELERINKLYTA